MRRAAQLLTCMALLAGCSDATAIGPNPDLETLRQVTAPFRTFDAALAAGWSAKITSCMSDPSLGGMGFHYGNTALIDGTVQVNKPQLLLYEPKADGSEELVAVEYIIPYSAHARSDAAPELFGQKFKQNDTFQLWGLHAWVWDENPSGIFASWNPRVTCAYATEAMVMTPP